MKNKNNNGFTLFELLIVIMIIAIIFPTIVLILLANVHSYQQVQVLQLVKRNGDNVLDFFERNLRNQVVSVYSDELMSTEVCTTKSSSNTVDNYSNQLYFKDRDGKAFYFSLTNGVLSYTLDGTASVITGSQVIITNYVLSCSRTSSVSDPIIILDFTVSQAATTTTRPEQQATFSYSTKYKLRS